jgi:hypothetical protein
VHETCGVLCSNLIEMRARPTPAWPRSPGGQLCGQLAAGRNVTPMLIVTVKPFEQLELHGTVTICPEFKIPNQKVTLK